MSSKFPIGVETMYKPVSNFSILFIFIFIASCVPVNKISQDKQITINQKVDDKNQGKQEKKTIFKKIDYLNNNKILNEIEIILPKNKNQEIVNNLINAFELSIYKKKIENIQLNINLYFDKKNLEEIIKLKKGPGKIFIGTLSSEEALIVKNYCSYGILFFSFSYEKNLAGDCVYLVNFFPEDDLEALFNFFPPESKIALLYPENFYGKNINEIIDLIAIKSKSLIISRSSYKQDLSNARESIKELGKYELRRLELQRQTNLLKNKNDEISKESLKKIIKFETLGNVDFTHLILPDYSIRLLEIAPLLPFYDVDPSKVQFVGTGVWDDNAFFDEPALQGAIFSGIEEGNREKFFNEYFIEYGKKPIRTSTIPYDLIGIMSYLVNNNLTIKEAYSFLDSGLFKFEGLDGKFYFKDNIIFRELDILEINNGAAKKLN